MKIDALSSTNYTSSDVPNRYKYNGKELFADLQWLNYGARFYDAAVGRWWVRDPKAEKYYDLTPYSYVGGNPVRMVDPNGMEISIHVDPYGNIIAKYDDGDNGVYMHSKGVTKSDIDEQRETLHNTGGFGHYIGELGGVVDADVIFENVLEKDMREAKSMVNPIKFLKYVKTGGRWDLKNNKNTIYGLGNNRQTKTKFLFQGKLMEPQDIGNFHFGVVALAFGFSKKFTLEGAGFYQIFFSKAKKEWIKFKRSYEPAVIPSPSPGIKLQLSPPYGDDPRDQYWIKQGFKYYENKK